MEITLLEGLTNPDGISGFKITVDYEEGMGRFRISFEVSFGYIFTHYTQKEGKWVMDTWERGWEDCDVVRFIETAQALHALTPLEWKGKFRNEVVHRLDQFVIQYCSMKGKKQLLKFHRLFKPFND